MPKAITARRTLCQDPASWPAIRLGYVPLIDAAPLLVADALGFFRDAGLDVRLSRELGWGSIREKIVYGELAGAAAPAGLLFSILLGTHAPSCRVSTDLVLNLQGNAITLSRRLWERGVRDGGSLRAVLRGEAPRKAVFAVVSPFSSHHSLLRGWLRSAGLDPDREVRLTVLPPPLVAEHMRAGQIDGFCVGEPWNSAAAAAGEGWIAATSATLAPGHVEKVLVLRDDFRARHPEACAALRGALVEACRYCDEPANRPAVVELLHERGVFPLARDILLNSLVGPFHDGVAETGSRRPFISFHRGHANDATRDRALWTLGGLVESRVVSSDTATRQRCLAAFLDSPSPVVSIRRQRGISRREAISA